MSIIMISREFVTVPYRAFSTFSLLMFHLQSDNSDHRKNKKVLITYSGSFLPPDNILIILLSSFPSGLSTGYFGLIIQKIAVTSMKDLDFSTIIEIIDNELSGEDGID